MKNKLWLVITPLLAVSLFLASGCAPMLVGAGAAAGAGAVAYIEGELKATEAVTLDRAWNATQAAAQDLGLVTETRQKDAVSARLEARGPEDRKVTINLTSAAPEVTEIGIRVGTFGDEAFSQRILEQIRSHY